MYTYYEHTPDSYSRCYNTCWGSTSDGVCDDGGPGAEYSVCSLGYDCADCGTRSISYTYNTVKYCSNSCSRSFDGVCDDGGPGSEYSLCETTSSSVTSTDCTDCGIPSGATCYSEGTCYDTCYRKVYPLSVWGIITLTTSIPLLLGMLVPASILASEVSKLNQLRSTGPVELTPGEGGSVDTVLGEEQKV